jgi:predicted esterase
MALNFGMQAKQIPAGIICLSGYMLRSTLLTNHKKFPACIMHGDNDSVIK